MSGKPNSEQAEVSRPRFVSLVCARLQFRWLESRDIVRDAIRDLFGNRRLEREQLVSDIVVACRAGKLRDPRRLKSLIGRHKVIRSLFRDRKRLTLPAELVPKKGDARPYRWPVPPIATEDELAQYLKLPSTSILDWLILPHRRRRTNVDHYLRRASRKRDGTIRWIEQPRFVLCNVQQRIARQIVSNIPLHECAHGFRSGHGIATCARPHIGKDVVLRIDLRDFFGSITFLRIRTLFAVAGYPDSIANRLAWLCTSPPLSDIGCSESRLPQGAPTSPSLANAVAFKLDRRLNGLASSLNVTYTRYADDLIFSGNDHFEGRTQRFVTSAAAIAMEEGFDVNFRKTRVMRRGQQQRVLGLTINQRLNTPRVEYETLRATLYNCARFGPDSQNHQRHPNFRESLRGRISHVASIHAKRGEKLMQLFRAIEWPK
ncbi:MAG: reverse transcriptase family protein [Planctomycetota bacterium]